MPERNFLADTGQGLRYALIGFFLGVSAPLGWAMLRLLLFGTEGQGIVGSFIGDIVRDPQHIAHYLYMGLGTAGVLTTFGFFIGRSHHQIAERARKLDVLNETIAAQKEDFEKRFCELNSNLKSYHETNAHIQKSIDPAEVIQLAADSLHRILGYDRVNILMFNDDRSELTFSASRGAGAGDAPQVVLPFDSRIGILHRALVENRTLLVEDMRRQPVEDHLQPPFDDIEPLRSRHFILCPIVISGEPVGLLGVDNKEKHKRLDDTDVDTVRLFANQVSLTLTKIRLLGGMETLISELEMTFENILRHRHNFSGLVSSLQEGSSATAGTIVKVSGSAQVIRKAVDDTSSAATEISAAIAQVSQNLGQLNSFMENSISAMTEISSTSQEVEKTATRSQKMSERVKVQAEEGVEMVSQSWQGLQNVSKAVDRSVQVIEELSGKGEEIDRIIAVINDINQKTHLLSLNASIIAAQAGDHGRPFAVVADEIRNLSDETTQSAEAIEQLVADIQSSTREAVSQITETRSQVDQGIELGRSTAESLSEILESSVSAMQMSEQIRKATNEQVHSSQMVAHSIEELGMMAGQVATASREQESGIGRIVQAITEIQTMADDMAGDAAHTEDEIRQTDAAVLSVGEMSDRIFTEMAQKKEESHEVIASLAQLKEQQGQEEAPADRLSA